MSDIRIPLKEEITRLAAKAAKAREGSCTSRVGRCSPAQEAENESRGIEKIRKAKLKWWSRKSIKKEQAY